MDNSETKTFLKKERSQTDANLTLERGRADESLFDKRKKAELETDQQVKSDRTESDEAIAKSRTAADTHSDPDVRVDQQRTETDVTIKAERLKIDEAIKGERTRKDVVLVEFLQKERSETDQSLSIERSETDIVVTASSKKLVDEKGEHKLTKDELTSRSELLALVSHDLRNPIGAIHSCAEMLLQDELNSKMSSETKYWIEFMKRNSQTALKLISDILDMERISNNKLVLSVQEENLTELLRTSSEPFIHASAAKGVLLRIILPAVGSVKCDRDRIQQVLSNLIGNALKFTPEGGMIVVKSEELPGEIKVSVCDTGKGIAEKDQAHIFDRYNQVDGKDTRGLGLGLHISKNLIEQHGGKIWVESTVGKGSTFFFTLPT